MVAKPHEHTHIRMRMRGAEAQRLVKDMRKIEPLAAIPEPVLTVAKDLRFSPPLPPE